jgi:hypothetical protein
MKNEGRIHKKKFRMTKKKRRMLELSKMDKSKQEEGQNLNSQNENTTR